MHGEGSVLATISSNYEFMARTHMFEMGKAEIA